MKRQSPIDPVAVVRVVADNVEQVAHHMHRMRASVNGMAHDGQSIAHGIRTIRDLVSPFVEWLKSK